MARVLDKSGKRAVHRAVRLLRTSELGATYEAAWQEFDADGEAKVWEAATADGVTS